MTDNKDDDKNKDTQKQDDSDDSTKDDEFDDEDGLITDKKGNKYFPESYVKKLRVEAKDNRVKAKNFEKDAKELKKQKEASMTDIEKAEARATEAEEKARASEDKLKKLEVKNLVLSQASKFNFNDLDVVEMLVEKELSGIEDVDSKSVSKILEQISKEKTYLVGGSKPKSPQNFGERNRTGDDDKNVGSGGDHTEELAGELRKRFGHLGSGRNR
jgi:hypothetical protein